MPDKIQIDVSKDQIEEIYKNQFDGLEQLFSNPMLRAIFNKMNADIGVSMDDMDRKLKETRDSILPEEKGV